jgi:cell division protein FtsB
VGDHRAVSTVEPSYEQLVALVVELTARLEQSEADNAALRAEVAKLRAQVGKDSTNSAVPPPKDSIAAKA